jgi:putative membrane protein
MSGVEGSMIAILLKWLVPWEFSWTFLALFALAGVLYWRGCRRRRIGFGRRLTFWCGMAAMYLSLHTYLDFYAEHEFFMHRLQQLLLHHVVPLMLVASYPGVALRAGLPLKWRARLLRPARRSRAWRAVAAVLFNPTVATVLFVVFILVWLVPSLQTMAMLDWRVYRFMNWSMIASGLVYWWLVLDHRPHPPGRMVVGMRVLSPGITMSPQILAGAIITFSRHDLYPIFEICGRAFTFNVITGQMVGGLIIWVPAATVESIGALMAMRHWLRLSRSGRIRRDARRRATATRAARVVGE